MALLAVVVVASAPYQRPPSARAERTVASQAPAARPGSVVGAAGFEHLGMPRLPRPVAVARPASTEIVPPARFEGPVAPAVPPPAALTSPAPAISGTGTWALVVGIDDYPGSGHDLRAARNDALAVEQALIGLGTPASQVLALHDGQATAGVIRAGVEWLNDHAGPDSVAVLFFAGHVRKLDSDTESLIGADGRDVTDAELARRLGRLRAGRAWVAIAGCYGGGFTEVLRPGRVLTGAAGADELAYENSGLPRSYMVEYMVQRAIIERRAHDTVQAAFRYAADAVGREYPGRQPVQVDASDGAVSLGSPSPAPRTDGSEAPPPTPPPPRTSQPPPSTPPTTAPPPHRDCLLGSLVC